MKFLASVPFLAALAMLVPSSTAATAQTVTTTTTPFEVASATSSSSSSNAFLFNSHASATQASVTPSNSGGYRGPFSGVAVGVKFGLAGVGFDVATPLVPRWINLRGGASFFSYTPPTITADNLNINGSLKFQNASVMADFFPFHNFLRLSGGMTVYNYTNLSATLTVPQGQSVKIGDNSYYSDPNAPLVGTGAFNFGGKTAGRVSIGTGNMLPSKGHFAFESEIGVQFFSEPTVGYTFAGEGCTDQTYTNCGPIPPSNIAAEQQKLQNDLVDLKYFPVFSVGLSYKIH
jgi:hypothetical protein